MSSFDKVVKLACKPKPAPPKPKYLDPIIAATWSEEGTVHDVCKALVPRLREPNAIVVFKALIVLHTMIRNGATDNVLSHLSSSEILRLRNVSTGNWDGYNTPRNMENYALYLDSRIRAYRELKHDAIRVQAESNRDLRLNNSIEEDMAYATLPPSKSSSTKSKIPQRSKTIMGRKLRLMTVEKGLLRETKMVQNMIDSLVECRFYLDDLEDELTITALRMLVKDLLILFQAGNEGVINVLEHYFEMSKYDAEEALGIYRQFCEQTERVVEYLGVAKKLQNLLNVPIPNLKHAPVSLASSLKEYLDDPNFEQNRIEYKTGNSNRNPKDRNGAPSAQIPTNSTARKLIKPPSPPPPSTKGNPDVNHAMADFFGSIEEEQTALVSGSPTANHFQPTVHNPFVQRQMTGVLLSQPLGGHLQVQPTGFPPSLPFQSAQPFQPTQLSLPQGNNFTLESQLPPQHRPFSTFVPPQATSLQPGPTTGFLQSQPTGVNPFRQSVLVSQATGFPTFNSIGMPPVPPLPIQQTGTLLQQMSNPQPQSLGQPVAQFGQVQHSVEIPARPASTPLTTVVSNPSSASPPSVQPVKSHQTGSRNPFGVPVTPAPPVPKPPTLLELSMGFGRLGVDGSQLNSQSQSTASVHQVTSTTTTTTGPTISTVASSFAFTQKSEENPSLLSTDLKSLGSQPLSFAPANTSSSASGSLFSPLGPTDSTATSHSLSSPVAGPIKAQHTGFGGVKPFKPSSSFGASLLESLPPIPQSGTTTPDPSVQPITQHASVPALPANLTLNLSVYGSSVGTDSNAVGGINSQQTGVAAPSQRMNGGPTLGVGLRPQATGALGAANPFRATMFATSAPSTANGTSVLATSASTPQFVGLSNGTGTLPAFGSAFGSGAHNPAFAYFGQDTQQQNPGASLI